MTNEGIERRVCVRFEIPGATISYDKGGSLFSPPKYGEEFCPVIDLSRGGLRFLSQKNIKVDSNLSMKLSVPGERIPLQLQGKVKWSAPSPGKSYKYQIGIQFNPYGEKKGQNYPGALVKIIALEQKFTPTEKSEIKKPATEEFETDDN